jgi:hypothetical protein
VKVVTTTSATGSLDRGIDLLQAGRPRALRGCSRTLAPALGVVALELALDRCGKINWGRGAVD